MAKTSAQRQAEYRARRRSEHSSERRINTYVSTQACYELQRLADRYGVTRRSVLEWLLFAKEAFTGDLLKTGLPSWDKADRSEEFSLSLETDGLLRNDLAKARSDKKSPKDAHSKLLRNKSLKKDRIKKAVGAERADAIDSQAIGRDSSAQSDAASTPQSAQFDLGF